MADVVRSTSRFRRIVWLALPVIVSAEIAGASSPTIAQRTPRFFFPALAAVGAALILYALVTSMFRLLRSYQRHERLQVFPIALSVLATMFLVVVPCARLIGVMTAPAGAGPRILAGFGDWLGGEGYPRLSPHRGMDVAGKVGDDVLAAAEGRVAVARDSGELCGLIVVIAHDPYGYRTVYCHFSAIDVKPGQMVKRGERIGALGTTGQRAWPGFEHVHLELQRGRDPSDVENPALRIVGCFDPRKSYPADRLVLTYPVKC